MDGDGETKLESELRKNPSLTMEEVEEIYRVRSFIEYTKRLGDTDFNLPDVRSSLRSSSWTTSKFRNQIWTMQQPIYSSNHEP